MLNFKHRLRLKKDFEFVIKNGANFNTPVFRAIFKKNNKNNSRFAFVIGSKIEKSAVKRNALKRKFRHAVRECLKQINPGDLDVIFFIKKQAVGIKFALLVEGISQFLTFACEKK